MGDFRLALRSLRHRPLFTIVAVTTLALGIGATTTLFTIVNAVLLRPLPYPDANRVVSISEAEDGKDQQISSAPDYLTWQQGSHAFSSMAVYGEVGAVVSGHGTPQRVNGAEVSVGFFSVFGTSPVLGRTFLPAEDVPGGPALVVLSHQLWQDAFNGDSSVLGRTISLDRTPYTVVGVMPAGFSAPGTSRYWVPRQLDSAPTSGVTFFVNVVGRLAPGISLEQARAELAALTRNSQGGAIAPGGHASARTPVLMTLHERLYGATRPALIMLLGAVGFLLLIACANVANLSLARALSRQREFAVRVALGGSRARLIRQLLWESVVVSVVAGAIGLLIPLFTVAYFVRISPASVARVQNIDVNGSVLAFAAAVALATGVVFGLVPALTATRPDAFRALREGTPRTTDTRAHRRLRGALVVLEMATALVMLIGAGLLTRSLTRTLAVDVGFRPAHALAITVGLSRDAYPNDTLAVAFFDRAVERIGAIPGVTSVGYADAPLVRGYRISVGVPRPGSDKPAVMALAQASGGFMEAAGLELVEGRLLSPADRSASPSPVVVSERAAQLLFSSGHALGETINLGSFGAHPVVGIIRDATEPGVDSPRLPQVYLPYAGRLDRPYLMAVRYTGAEAGVESAVRGAFAGSNPVDVQAKVAPMESQLDPFIAPRRFNSTIIDVFAALALVLAAVGLYGVMAYQVAERTRELGIRMALGADRAHVLRFVLRQGMGLALLGATCGVALSLALSRFLAGMLYGVTPRDVPTFGGVSAALILVALAACYLPARRATKVDPMVALRYE